jgi:cytochrome c556
MIGKLPFEFKTLALSVHSDFDTIAMDAQWTGLPKRTLGQLSDVLQKCAKCHESYRLADVTSR